MTSSLIYAKKVYCKSVWEETYWHAHKESFFKKVFEGFDVVFTKTLTELSDFDYLVTEEVPWHDKEIEELAKYPTEKILLFSFETQLLNPRSQDTRYHKHYSKIFTWNDDLIDNVKYFKVRYPWMDPLPMLNDRPDFDTKKLCIFVANYSCVPSPFSNQCNRINLIHFFEKNAPTDLDLFGRGWQQFQVFKGPISQVNRRHAKINTLKNYKFDLCFENTKNVNGWLSERIFEDFAAGCIPIYSGSDNIRDYIPENCFIDYNRFTSDQELYSYLKNMPKEEYEQYIENILGLLSGTSLNKLSTVFFIQNIRHVLQLDDNYTLQAAEKNNQSWHFTAPLERWIFQREQ